MIIRPDELPRNLDPQQEIAVQGVSETISKWIAGEDWSRLGGSVDVETFGLQNYSQSLANPDGSDKVLVEAVQRHIDNGWNMRIVGDVLRIDNPNWKPPRQENHEPKRNSSCSVFPVVAFIIFSVCSWNLNYEFSISRSIIYGAIWALIGGWVVAKIISHVNRVYG